MILTLDLGTSATKAAIWDQGGLRGFAGSPLETTHPEPGLSEQDPGTWWSSVEGACADLCGQVAGGLRSVEAIGLTGARQTFSLFDGDGAPLVPGILWSDRRAATEADALAVSRGVDPADASAPGGPLDGGSVAAKLAWLASHRGAEFAATAWILSPRDLAVWRLTGEVVTDVTMASRAGLHDAEGRVDLGLAVGVESLLPPMVAPDRAVGQVGREVAAQLGVPPGTPVVIGAGDRQCEVLGTGATETRPLVSWGTTANLSVPVRGASRPHPPSGVVASLAADGGWLLEAGLSAAGSFLAWLGRLTGVGPPELAARAATAPPGARGVLATPWLEGARAPWWRPDAGACFAGLGSAHGLEDLARAVFESVGWEVRRCLAAAAARRPPGRPPTELALGGSGSTIPVWAEVLTGITGLVATRRTSGQAASAGAALLAATGAGIGWDLDVVDPPGERTVPGAGVHRYEELRDRADRLAGALVGLDERPGAAASAAPVGATRPWWRYQG